MIKTVNQGEVMIMWRDVLFIIETVVNIITFLIMTRYINRLVKKQKELDKLKGGGTPHV